MSTHQATAAVRPFQVTVPEAELGELRRRINATRWPERETVTDASQGVQLATTQALADAQTEMAIQQARLRSDIFAMLTPDQQAQARKLEAERLQRAQ